MRSMRGEGKDTEDREIKVKGREPKIRAES
jgi:hypothetical protein